MVCLKVALVGLTAIVVRKMLIYLQIFKKLCFIWRKNVLNVK